VESIAAQLIIACALLNVSKQPKGYSKMSVLTIKKNEPKGKTEILASDLSVRQIFTRNRRPGYFMRISPTSYLLNSKTVQENVNKAKPLILNLNEGTCYFIEGTEIVRPVSSANLKVIK
jgi:hypothetical protein